MRIARISPRSSVTVGYSCVLPRSGERGFGVDGRVRQAAEPDGGEGGFGGGRGAGVPADPGEALPEVVGDGRIELGERIADDPRSVAIVGAGGEVGLVP